MQLILERGYCCHMIKLGRFVYGNSVSNFPKGVRNNVCAQQLFVFNLRAFNTVCSGQRTTEFYDAQDRLS